MPSKFYGIAAVGRPIISVTSLEGETAGLVRRHACGLVVEPGDGASLAEALMQLAKDPQAAATWGNVLARCSMMALPAGMPLRAGKASWQRL